MIIAIVEDAKGGAWDIKLQPNMPQDIEKVESGHYDAARVGLILMNMADILLRTFVGEVRARDRGDLEGEPGQASSIVIAPAHLDLNKLPKPGSDGR